MSRQYTPVSDVNCVGHFDLLIKVKEGKIVGFCSICNTCISHSVCSVVFGRVNEYNFLGGVLKRKTKVIWTVGITASCINNFHIPIVQNFLQKHVWKMAWCHFICTWYKHNYQGKLNTNYWPSMAVRGIYIFRQ